MKLNLVIFFLGLFVSGKGQTLADVEKRLKLLLNPTKLHYDTTGFSTLPKIDFFCDDENKNNWAYYHVVDLNKDGRSDLIYSGPCMPYFQTAIFLNDGLNLNQVHSYPGNIISIEQESDRAIVNILMEGCCCDYFSDYIEVTIHNNSRVDKNQITFDNNTKLDLSNLAEIEVTGTLRTSAELDDIEKKEDCTNQIVTGNHLTYINKLVTVFQLQRAGQWRLILYPEDKEKSWIGWIKVDQ
jgi:hypothetical protein